MSTAVNATLPLHVAGDAALSWTELVPDDAGDIEIEIGSGKGSFIVEAARSRPETYFVGIEAGPSYAEFCADRIVRQGLQNACMVADDARLFLKDSVPQGRIRRLHIYYPDPWPKRRHRKRRIFDSELPWLAHRILVPDGELLVATDNTRYFGEILAVCGASAALSRSKELEERYGIEDPGLAFGPSNFSKKYRELGRHRYRAAYLRQQLEAGELMNAPHDGGNIEEKTWHRVAGRNEIPKNGTLAVKVADKELALFRTQDKLYCLADTCPHRGAALSEGHIENGEIVCPWHGWRYRLEDGECSTLPGSMNATTFAVMQDGDDVLVQL